MLARHMPVIAVITKARSDQGFKSEVQRLLPRAVNVVRVRALAEELDEGVVLPVMGLKELADLTAEVIPEGVRMAFVRAQKASREQRRKEAQSIVNWVAGQAALIGATPIPVSDAALLIPLQIKMLAKISALYGIDNSEVVSALFTMMAPLGASFVGRTVVSNLLKMVPGIGSAAGGLISGSTAAALTTTMGNLYISAIEKACSDLKEGEVPSAERIKGELKRSIAEATK